MTAAPAMLRLSAVAARLGVSPCTVRGWVTRGVRGVRLGAVRAGGSWRCSEQALADFLAALAPAEQPPPDPTPAARRRASEAASRELERAGW